MRAAFLVHRDGLVIPRHLPLVEGSYCVGRSRNCNLQVNHVSVSRRHAKIEVESDRLIVRDLKSRNGTFHLGRRISAVAIVKLGESLGFGKVNFQFSNLPELQVDSSTQETNSDVQDINVDTLQLVQLTEARKKVLKALREGLSEREIAIAIGLSTHTVHNHLRAIYEAFNVHSKSELFAVLLKIAERKN